MRAPTQDEHDARNHDARVRERVADSRVDRRYTKKTRLSDEDRPLENITPLDDAAVWIDDSADSGVRRTHQVATLFDRAHRGLLEMLVRRRRRAKPRVVGDRRQQF